jgi:hypothetical protein
MGGEKSNSAAILDARRSIRHGLGGHDASCPYLYKLPVRVGRPEVDGTGKGVLQSKVRLFYMLTIH